MLMECGGSGGSTEVTTDSGSNTKFTYTRKSIKFADGLLINIIDAKTKGSTSYTFNTWGNGSFATISGSDLPDWITSFNDAPFLVSTSADLSMANHMPNPLINYATATSPGTLRVFRPDTGVTTSLGTVRIWALGTWK